MTFFRKFLATDASAAVILIRLILGVVFLSEGVRKFVYPESLGWAALAKSGFRHPSLWPLLPAYARSRTHNAPEFCRRLDDVCRHRARTKL